MFLEFFKGYRLRGRKTKRPPWKVILMCKFYLHELSIEEIPIRPASESVINSNTTRVSTPDGPSHIKALAKIRNEIALCIFL